MNQLDHILSEAPRLGREDAFAFACHSKLSCFNQCCRDLTIELTPADVLDLRLALGLSAAQFIKQHAIVHFEQQRGLPALFLKMADGPEAACPFVTAEGCSVYAHRPSACRLYPMGRARLAGGSSGGPSEFFFLLEEDPCTGYEEPQPWTVQEWLDAQGVSARDARDEGFVGLCQHPRLRELLSRGQSLSPMQLNAYFMALYHQDRFVEYLDRKSDPIWMDLDANARSALAKNSQELLIFAAAWVERTLFGPPQAGPDRHP